MAIEAEKAKERQGNRTDIQETFPRSSNGQSRDKAGATFGISGKQAEKVLFVDDNRDLLDPADFAKVGIYADQRIGEILRELPKAKGNQYQQSTEVGTPTKAQAIKQANIDHHIAIDLQAMAANPEVVHAVLEKAYSSGCAH